MLGFLAVGVVPAAGYGPIGVAVDRAHIYWANDGSGVAGIGRANLDGTGVVRRFIAVDGDPRGVAVDASHIYWVNNHGDSIGRADLDGTHVNQTLVSGISDGRGIAVGPGGIYWANNGGRASTIGRANLDGTNVDQGLITGIPPARGGPQGVAVDAAHIYWGSFFADLLDHSGQIGWAGLGGSAVNDALIAASGYAPDWVTLDGSHLYWSNYDDGNIGRSNLDGSAVNYDFVGASGAVGLAVDGAHIYWGDAARGAIGRSNVDGTGIDRTVVTGIDPAPPSPSACVVPLLTHKTLAQAKATLRLAHCTLGKLTGRHRRGRRLVVAKQHPAAGTMLAAGAAVNVRVR